MKFALTGLSALVLALGVAMACIALGTRQAEQLVEWRGRLI